MCISIYDDCMVLYNAIRVYTGAGNMIAKISNRTPETVGIFHRAYIQVDIPRDLISNCLQIYATTETMGAFWSAINKKENKKFIYLSFCCCDPLWFNHHGKSCAFHIVERDNYRQQTTPDNGLRAAYSSKACRASLFSQIFPYAQLSNCTHPPPYTRHHNAAARAQVFCPPAGLRHDLTNGRTAVWRGVACFACQEKMQIWNGPKG